jgi:hypothetical protein
MIQDMQVVCDVDRALLDLGIKLGVERGGGKDARTPCFSTVRDIYKLSWDGISDELSDPLAERL